jgi:Cu2+-containing amine oxidase
MKDNSTVFYEETEVGVEETTVKNQLKPNYVFNSVSTDPNVNQGNLVHIFCYRLSLEPQGSQNNNLALVRIFFAI